MEASLYGKLDSNVQHYQCHVHDLDSLLQLSGGRPFSHWIGSDDIGSIRSQINPSDFSTWFPHDEDRMAIYGSTTQAGLSYAALHKQIEACPSYRGSGDPNEMIRVALMLPLEMRPEMAVILVALLSQPNVIVVPLDYNMDPSKTCDVMCQLQCAGLVTTHEYLAKMKWKESLPMLQDVRAVESAGHEAGTVRWTLLQKQTTIIPAFSPRHRHPDEPRMLLRTSGTTAGPKVVALTATHLLHYGACLALGLGLQPTDICCNAMPLFHIGGMASALLAVLVSGSSVVMIPGPFDAQEFLERLDPRLNATNPPPTWYYAAPTIHQALMLASRGRSVPNQLRLIRNAAAHLPHAVALELSKTFDTAVFPTYGMTECMPIAIPSEQEAIVWNRESKIVDSVGCMAGTSLAIVDVETDEPLAYGEVGEIAVYGPGALSSYVGLDPAQTHTRQGWLKTGDVGCLDRQGRLYIKGRSKEMIKRGGEQVWPNEIDSVIQKIPGVSLAITFGVPNELWGEEVAVAVVLETDRSHETDRFRRTIMDACRRELDDFAIPRQIVFVGSTKDLARGPTGKYLRTRMAAHLGVKSVDTGALRILQGTSLFPVKVSSEASDTLSETEFDSDEERELIDKTANLTKNNIKPSSALNGVRFITACFVVQIHLGFFQSMAWTKIQSFSMSMPIFFHLVGFQTTCNVQSEVYSNWSSFVGSKIGSMHALFVLAELFGFPAWYTTICGPTGFAQTFRGGSCWDTGYFPRRLELYLGQLLTGMIGFQDGNLSSVWFQSVAYQFLIVFPWVDTKLRQMPTKQLIKLLAAVVPLTMVLPFSFFQMDWRILHFTFLTWWPQLLSSMICGHLFKRCHPSTKNTDAHMDGKLPIYQRPSFWGYLTDFLSVSFLMLLVAVGLSRNCADVELETFEEMRPGEIIGDDDDQFEIEFLDGEKYVWLCDITWEEYVDFVREDTESWVSLGRMESTIASAFWEYRIGSPLILLWLYGMAYGRGLTVRIMNSKILQALAPLSYTVYLLHIPIARYYWLATRGFVAEEWWNKLGDFPMPIALEEVLFILCASVALGYFIDRKVIPHVMPWTVKVGIKVCNIVSCLLGCSTTVERANNGGSTMIQVKRLVKALSGLDVTRDSNLHDLGLDSLGATAFLGNLRASVRAANSLTLRQMNNFRNVGELVDYLDEARLK